MSGLNNTFKALADRNRRRIISMLKERDMTAGEIAERFSISKPSISHHLNILKQAKLVLAERKGQHVYYSLNTTVVQDLLNWVLDLKDYRKGGKNDE